MLLLSAAVLGQEGPWPTAGWPVSAPQARLLQAEHLAEASCFIQANCPTRFSLLIVRHGHLVFERYCNGGCASQPENIKSMAKSVRSVLTGIAHPEKLLRGVDQRLWEFHPECFDVWADPRKFDITLAQLLSGILTKVSGSSTLDTLDYATSRLFAPIGMEWFEA